MAPSLPSTSDKQQLDSTRPSAQQPGAAEVEAAGTPPKYAVVASAVVPDADASACSNGAAEPAETGAGDRRVPEALCQLLPQQFPTVSAAKRAVRRGHVLLNGRRAGTHT